MRASEAEKYRLCVNKVTLHLPSVKLLEPFEQFFAAVSHRGRTASATHNDAPLSFAAQTLDALSVRGIAPVIISIPTASFCRMHSSFFLFFALLLPSSSSFLPHSRSLFLFPFLPSSFFFLRLRISSLCFVLSRRATYASAASSISPPVVVAYNEI